MKAPALLSFNPELQRNLWLELTVTRLIAAPLVLTVLLGGVGSVFGTAVATGLAMPVLWALLSLWGSRLAAESFGDEATGRTWDVQRLSAQTAWGLTLGKLAGGTVFVWYCAAISALVLSLLGVDVSRMLYRAALSGLTAQSAAFFAVLLLHRFDSRARRAHTTLAQIVGIVAGWNSDALLLAPPLESTIGIETVNWYGLTVSTSVFIDAIRAATIAWFVFGAMRLIRREVGFQDGPLGWLLYTVYTVALVLGFGPDPHLAASEQPRLAGAPFAGLGIQSLGAIAAFSLTYMAVLGTPISRITLAKLNQSMKSGNWHGVWRNLPIWVPSAITATILAVLLTARLTSTALADPAATIPIAALGFLARDVGLVTFMRLTYRQRTAMALLVMFIFLYGLLPALLARSGDAILAPFFYPTAHMTLTGLLIPWLEAAVAWLIAWRRSRTPAALAR